MLIPTKYVTVEQKNAFRQIVRVSLMCDKFTSLPCRFSVLLKLFDAGERVSTSARTQYHFVAKHWGLIRTTDHHFGEMCWSKMWRENLRLSLTEYVKDTSSIIKPGIAAPNFMRPPGVGEILRAPQKKLIKLSLESRDPLDSSSWSKLYSLA